MQDGGCKPDGHVFRYPALGVNQVLGIGFQVSGTGFGVRSSAPSLPTLGTGYQAPGSDRASGAGMPGTGGRYGYGIEMRDAVPSCSL